MDHTENWEENINTVVSLISICLSWMSQSIYVCFLFCQHPQTFNSWLIFTHLINQWRAVVLAKMSQNPRSQTQSRPLASSPSTVLADPQWAWHWCHSTAEPDGDTLCQTRSLTHCTAEGTQERADAVDGRWHQCISIKLSGMKVPPQCMLCFT